MFADDWQSPAAEVNGEPELASPTWSKAEYESPPVTGCENLRFEPTDRFQPRPTNEGGTTEVAAPSGYEFELHIPQKESVGELETPQLKDTTVTLPAGVVLSPGAANGLEACSAAQIEIESEKPGHCPSASRVGEVTIESALLSEPLTGKRLHRRTRMFSVL